MLKGLRVPSHRVDAPGVLILPHDDAWDKERIEAEGDELEAAALADLRAAAVERYAADRQMRVDELADEQRAEAEASCALTDVEKVAARATHPWVRYLQGETRFQLDAPDQGPRGPACAADYIRPDAKPARLHLRRIPWREKAQIDIERDLFVRFERWAQAGLAGVDAGEVQWRAKPGAETVPEDVLAAVCDGPEGGAANRLIQIAGACKRFSDPPTSAEGKR